MDSIDLIRSNLARSRDIVLSRVEEMEPYCLVRPTPNGGCHTLWVIGHLAYVEGLVTRRFMLGEPNPLEAWAEMFDGEEVWEEAEQFVPFRRALAECRAARASTLAALETLTERDLDRESTANPQGTEALFGTFRACFQYVADHWYMHRGQLADSRRAAGRGRMWY